MNGRRPLPLAAELRTWPGRHEILPLQPVFEEQNTRPPTLVFKFYILDANFKADCQDAGVEWTERAHFPLWRDAYCRFFWPFNLAAFSGDPVAVGLTAHDDSR